MRFCNALLPSGQVTVHVGVNEVSCWTVFILPTPIHALLLVGMCSFLFFMGRRHGLCWLDVDSGGPYLLSSDAAVALLEEDEDEDEEAMLNAALALSKEVCQGDEAC